MKYGIILKHIRISKNLSQSELCRGIMSVSNLSNFENGYYTPSFDKVIELLRRMNVGLDEFYHECFAEEKQAKKYLERIVSADSRQDIPTLISINEALESNRLFTGVFEECFMLSQYMMILIGENCLLSNQDIQFFSTTILNESDTWYTKDFRVLNNFFISLPLENSRIFYDTVIRKNKNSSTNLSSKYLFSLSINYCLKLIGEKQFHAAISLIDIIEKKYDPHSLLHGSSTLSELRNIAASETLKESGTYISNIIKNTKIFK